MERCGIKKRILQWSRIGSGAAEGWGGCVGSPVLTQTSPLDGKQAGNTQKFDGSEKLLLQTKDAKNLNHDLSVRKEIITLRIRRSSPVVCAPPRLRTAGPTLRAAVGRCWSGWRALLWHGAAGSCGRCPLQPLAPNRGHESSIRKCWSVGEFSNPEDGPRAQTEMTACHFSLLCLYSNTE